MMQLVSEHEASRLQAYTLRVAQNGGALVLTYDEREDLARILDKVLVGIELDELQCMWQNSKLKRSGWTKEEREQWVSTFVTNEESWKAEGKHVEGNAR